MISLWHRCIFIHIPKCGGQSVDTAFLTDIGSSWKYRRLVFCMVKPKEWRGPPRLAHLMAREYIELNYVPRALFQSMFSFAVVRNPFDRTISHWKHRYQRIGFEDFITRKLPKLSRLDNWFTRPQWNYVIDPEQNQMVKRVVRLEDMKSEWPSLKKQCGLNCDFPHVNKRTAKSPVIWTQEMVEIMREVYSVDFERFGYPSEPNKPAGGKSR